MSLDHTNLDDWRDDPKNKKRARSLMEAMKRQKNFPVNQPLQLPAKKSFYEIVRLNAVNQNYWAEAHALDMDWITHDWPYAVLNDTHLVVWKKVRLKHMTPAFQVSSANVLSLQILLDYLDELEQTYQWQDLQNEMYVGVLGCPYKIGDVIHPFGLGNWTLSPLGAMKDQYIVWPFLLASLIAIKDLKMRHDQVLISKETSPILPLGVWSHRWFLKNILTWLNLEQDRDLKIVDWLADPNQHAHKIDTIEFMMRQQVNDALPHDWHQNLLLST